MKQYKLGSKYLLVLVVLGITAESIVSGMINYVFKEMTDIGIEQDLEGMLPLTKYVVILVLGYIIVGGLSMLIKGNYLKKSLMLVKEKYISKLLKQDITQLQKEDTQKYYNNLTNDMDRYENQYLKNIFQIVQILTSLIVGIVMLGIINMWLVYVALVLIAIFVVIAFKSSTPIQEKEEKKSGSLESYTAYIKEVLSGFEVIKSHRLENKHLNKFTKHAETLQEDEYQIRSKEIMIKLGNFAIQFFMLFGIMIAGTLTVRSFGFTVGDVIVIVAAFSNAIMPLQNLGKITSQMAAMKPVFDDFDENLTKPVYNRPNTLDSFNELVIDKCDLGYDKPILSNVTMKVNNKEKVLIIGPSGAGKSTILKTIRQTLTPLKGEVLTNGIDAFSITPQSYYDKFANVDQIGFVYDGTIKDNISLYKETSDSHIETLLNQVGLNDFNVNDVIVDDGKNISGGQRARLMIARALFFESDVILCDEIFASLDEDIAKSIERDLLNTDKTILNISHIIFPEHIDKYDSIYLVDNGEVYHLEDKNDVKHRLEEMSLLFN